MFARVLLPFAAVQNRFASVETLEDLAVLVNDVEDLAAALRLVQRTHGAGVRVGRQNVVCGHDVVDTRDESGVVALNTQQLKLTVELALGVLLRRHVLVRRVRRVNLGLDRGETVVVADELALFPVLLQKLVLHGRLAAVRHGGGAERGAGGGRARGTTSGEGG